MAGGLGTRLRPLTRLIEIGPSIENVLGGSERIRTSETFAGLAVFKTAPFNHSGTLPRLLLF